MPSRRASLLADAFQFDRTSQPIGAEPLLRPLGFRTRARARSSASIETQSLERCSLRVAKENWVHVLHDVACDLQEAAFVFKRNERSFGAIIHRHLQWLNE